MKTGRRPVLGVIADDFTGATDVASMLVRAGMRTLQTIGVPQPDGGDREDGVKYASTGTSTSTGTSSSSSSSRITGARAGPSRDTDDDPLDADAIVVALKSRTIAATEAVGQSLAAWRWLQAAGARQCYFKICSTFDSTPAGNIGPVADALLEALGAAQAIVCPALPENGRTVYRGHLFVGDQLLAESGMRQHPLTPMTDSNLVRVLQAQRAGRVGLLAREVVAAGAAAVQARLRALHATGDSLVVADAVTNDDLLVLAEAAADMPLVVAGSGVALGLPAAYARRGWLEPDAGTTRLEALPGACAVLAGSCSPATQAQVAHWRAAGRPAFAVDALQLAAGRPVVAEALDWARRPLPQGPVLIHATLPADALAAVQAELGAARAGGLVEDALAGIARGLVDEAGVQRLVVAGGETSGAVVQALGVRRLRIGAAICPGVPWTQARRNGRPLDLALKSGNFGGPDFFAAALAADA